MIKKKEIYHLPNVLHSVYIESCCLSDLNSTPYNTSPGSYFTGNSVNKEECQNSPVKAAVDS